MAVFKHLLWIQNLTGISRKVLLEIDLQRLVENSPALKAQVDQKKIILERFVQFYIEIWLKLDKINCALNSSFIITPSRLIDLSLHTESSVNFLFFHCRGAKLGLSGSSIVYELRNCSYYCI